ncbi:MAG TPA: hypothetical protein VKD04_03470 [Burkholderiales bacterium]|nr:hypothetical protein [Burkholderiales bacterium]
MSVEIITSADICAQKYRRVFVMVEERLGHYAGFREALIDAFGLTAAHADGGPPGYFRAPSGREYEVVFISRSGQRFPSGVEIHALVPGFDAIDPEAVDEDTWRFLEWLIPRVGGEWTLEALKATGKVYKIPWA